MKAFLYQGQTVSVYKAQYSNGNTAVQLNDVMGFSVIKISVNVPKKHMESEYIIVKTYSENEGILSFLLKHNIVSSPIDVCDVGWTICPIVKILPEEEWTGYRIYTEHEWNLLALEYTF